MSDLADRLRADADQLNIEFGECSAAGSMREAAAELDRLGLIVGKAAVYTDPGWAAELVARDALAAAQGYWERHLQETGGR